VTIDVQKAVLAFAQEVQDLLDSVLPRPDDVPPEDRQVQVPFIDGRYSVRVAADHARIALTKNGARVGYLRVTFQCTSDTALTYLAVHKSTFELLGFSDRQPIARLDFVRDVHTVPAAHWNIHAERGTVSRLLGRTNPDHAGVLSALHFPVGGARMRPCLEDFLQFLLHEFLIDVLPDTPAVLAEGRERWRRRQVGALVRDAPDEAVRVLTELGYGVSSPATGEHKPNSVALQRW
jgi:hypothetical protein